MPRTITETAISSAAKRAATSGQRVELTDAACPGLRLRITPKGARTWVLGMRDSAGALRRFALGSYSDELGIAKARQAAAAQRAKVKAGAEPIAEARRKRALTRDAKAGIGTLEALLDLYGAQQGQARKSWPECRRRIDSVFAQHLARPLETLRRTDLQITADSWSSQSSAGAAVRYIRPVLRWAAGRDLLTIDAANLSPPAVVKRRDRVLSRDELARLLPVLAASDDPYAAATLYILLTLARREEVCGALWRDVDLKAATWTIPRTKNGQPHIVPLSYQAVALLTTRGPGKPADRVFANSVGGALANWDRATKAQQVTSATAGWTRHDLRRTGATMLGELGETPDIIEAALNHVAIRSALAATYNRSRYRPQVAAALQRLADALDGITRGGAQVIQLHGSAS